MDSSILSLIFDRSWRFVLKGFDKEHKALFNDSETIKVEIQSLQSEIRNTKVPYRLERKTKIVTPKFTDLLFLPSVVLQETIVVFSLLFPWPSPR